MYANLGVWALNNEKLKLEPGWGFEKSSLTNVAYIVPGKVSVRLWNITSQWYRRIISENLRKCRKTSKKNNYTHFFQFFKHLKQQQHQIDTLLHKYDDN